jgi:hypothetical protein
MTRLTSLGLGVLVLLTIFLTYRYLDRRDQIEDSAFASARNQAQASAASINEAFSSIKIIADTIADDLTAGDLAYTDIEARMRHEMRQRPDIDGLAITFAPFVFDEDLRLFQMYLYQDGEGGFDLLTGATYDYTQPQGDDPDAPNTDWYLGPMANGPTWNEPFFARGAQKILIEYGIPFFRDGVEAGVVTIDYSLATTRDLIADLDLGATGYGFLLSAEGTYLAHPVTERVARTTIFDIASTSENGNLEAIGERALQGETFSTTIQDEITGATSWVFIEPVTTTGWSLGIVLSKREFMPGDATTVREQIAIALSGAAAIVILVGLVTRGVWMVSNVFSLLAVALIVLIWFLAADDQNADRVTITDHTALDRYLEQRGDDLIRLPTGIYIQALQFPDPVSLRVNGYIWQRVDDAVEPGFMLPQRIGEEATLEEVYHQDDVVIWYFGMTLAQNYDTLRYPFDTRSIDIRISPAELDGSVILVPDLDGYPLIQPDLRPGVDNDIYINNWTVKSSVYNYQSVSFNSTFGLERHSGTMPELYFSLYTERRFVGPFIAYLLPGMVVAFMMFAFLLSDRKAGDKEEIVTTLNYVAALFFVVAIAHASLRDGIAAEGLTYLESVYIMLYIAIVGVALNVFLIAKRPDLALIRYRNNIIIKLLYWPAVMGVLLAITLMVFVV